MVLESQKKQQTCCDLSEDFAAVAAVDSRGSLLELVDRGLSKQERLVVLLCYSERLSAAEVGQVLDLSEARVNQIHASVLSRLRAQMHWQGGDAAGCAD